MDRKAEKQAESRREADRESRLFVAAMTSREVYLAECAKVEAERQAEWAGKAGAR